MTDIKAEILQEFRKKYKARAYSGGNPALLFEDIEQFLSQAIDRVREEAIRLDERRKTIEEIEQHMGEIYEENDQGEVFIDKYIPMDDWKKLRQELLERINSGVSILDITNQL